MPTLFFIRHAESEANKQRLLGSREDFPLTPAGFSDARRIAAELKMFTDLDRIVTSPVLRARQTAEVFAEMFNIVPIFDENLSEQELGPFSGKSYDDVRGMDGYEQNPRARWDWHPGDGGESYSMVADRVVRFFESVDELPHAAAWLIVTHAIVFRLLRAVLEDTLPDYPVGFPNNGEIWQVDYQGMGVRHEIEQIFLGHSRDFVHRP